ncbi:unnamed protein product [Amoebophrya sp. A120]|nr:unnamed protein product [Amoebophrya sp. A120]|eukprot:GSA120T00002961001.1
MNDSAQTFRSHACNRLDPVDCFSRPIPKNHFHGEESNDDLWEELYRNPQFYELHAIGTGRGARLGLKCRICHDINDMTSRHIAPLCRQHKKNAPYASPAFVLEYGEPLVIEGRFGANLRPVNVRNFPGRHVPEQYAKFDAHYPAAAIVPEGRNLQKSRPDCERVAEARLQAREEIIVSRLSSEQSRCMPDVLSRFHKTSGTSDGSDSLAADSSAKKKLSCQQRGRAKESYAGNCAARAMVRQPTPAPGKRRGVEKSGADSSSSRVGVVRGQDRDQQHRRRAAAPALLPRNRVAGPPCEDVKLLSTTNVQQHSQVGQRKEQLPAKSLMWARVRQPETLEQKEARLNERERVLDEWQKDLELRRGFPGLAYKDALLDARARALNQWQNDLQTFRPRFSSAFAACLSVREKRQVRFDVVEAWAPHFCCASDTGSSASSVSARSMRAASSSADSDSSSRDDSSNESTEPCRKSPRVDRRRNHVVPARSSCRKRKKTPGPSQSSSCSQRGRSSKLSSGFAKGKKTHSKSRNTPSTQDDSADEIYDE